MVDRASGITADRLPRGDNLRDRTLRVLRQAVVSGEIRSGEMYSATALARQLGVSVSPVREAMLTLVHDGILEPVRNRGFRVVPLAARDLEEIVEARMLLEVPVVVGLAHRDLAEHQPRLHRLAVAIEDHAARGDVSAFLVADRDFHLALLEIAGNRCVAELVGRLRDQTRLYGLHSLAEQGLLVTAAREHHALLDALTAGRADQASGLMRTHLAHVTRDWSTGEPPQSRQG